MGSGCEAVRETVDYLNQQEEKVGVIKVRLYRPFDIPRFIAALPDTVKSIAVLDRTKEPGSLFHGKEECSQSHQPMLVLVSL
ncbi:MAG: hypothetical protein QNJ41_07895 [Xenococcaceae cyanobacterium MO_188.B32]|nr:hypothetical protein [Xenococcaceae cyanobacterium MO_188.B32]